MGLFDRFRKKKTAGDVAKEVVDTAVEAGKVVADQAKKGIKFILDLAKVEQRAKIIVDLLKDKPGIPEVARVFFVIDRSLSMNHLYANGTVQEVAERCFPLGVKFDDNEAIDVFSFSSVGAEKHHGEMTKENAATFIKDTVMKEDAGGTYYAPVIEMIIKEAQKDTTTPIYVMFVVDGDCGDKLKARELITEAAKLPIFFQFIGLGSAGMAFLEDLDEMEGRVIDNANFFRVLDINSMRDDELYRRMMAEYPDWCVEAKAKGIITQ